MTEEMITIGQLGGAFGVRGEVRLKSFCANAEDIADYAPFTSPDGKTFAQLVVTGKAKGVFTARIDGITSKEEADAFKGTDLQVARNRLPALPDDEFYYTDLIGLDVCDTSGVCVGSVRAVRDHGAGDLLELIVPGASATVMVPFTREVVPTVDLAAKRIVIDPPVGIMPEDK